MLVKAATVIGISVDDAVVTLRAFSPQNCRR
jgi:hypothetical protein